MGTELLILIGSIVGGTGAMLSFWAGWRARDRQDQPGANRDLGAWLMPLPRDQDPDWRRSFNHENINKPSGPPPFRLQRSGYRSINYPDPSPDRRPTNPYSGEPVDFTEGRTQRGNGSGGPSTPKPAIIPKPQNRRNPFISDFQQQINDYLGLNGGADGN